MTERRSQSRIDGLPDLPKPITNMLVGDDWQDVFDTDQMDAHYLKGYEAGSAAAAQAAKQVPEGFVLVPREPTLEMGWAYLEAAQKASPHIDHAFNHPGYRAALAAAPSATSLAEAAALCVCGDRPATECDEEWGPKCDLGNNAAHAQVSTTDPALIDAALAAPEAAEAGLLTNVGTDKPLNTSSTFASPEVMRSALAATPASPQAPAPQAVVGEASALKKLATKIEGNHILSGGNGPNFSAGWSAANSRSAQMVREHEADERNNAEALKLLAGADAQIIALKAKATQDAIRLDALERNEWECLLSGEPGAMQWYIVSYDTHVLDGLKVGKFGKTPREAIDSALEQTR